MCDKNSVLFTDVKCVVLSPDFKLTDESHVLLKVPRKDNMYRVDLRNVVPQGGLTCLFAKATPDESDHWHRRRTCIENLIDLREKVIRCDNRTEFKNRIMNQFYEMKGTKREFSVARTPQQNGVAERKNRTLIEAARSMLFDSKLPTTFWTEAVNTACYVQNKVLVIKPHNKTPYELFLGRKPALSFMRPFGCLVTILNTIDHLDALTKSMNYEPVVAGNQSNGNAGTKENIDAGRTSVETVPGKDYILLPLWTQDPSFPSSLKDSSDAGFKPSGEEEKKDFEDSENEDSKVSNTEEPRVNINSTNTTVSSTFNVASIEDNVVDENTVYRCNDDPNMRNLEEIDYSDDDEDVGAEADITNLNTHIPISPILTTRIHKDHPVEQIIRDMHSAPQTRRMTKNVAEHEEPKKVIQALKDPSWIEAMQEELLQFKLQQIWTLVELPNGKRAIGTKWIYINKKDERGIVVRNKGRLVAQGHTQEEGIDYDEVFALVARIEPIRLFLAYASFKDFVVYQMDVKSTFLYGKIEEEVYVYQPLGFEDPEFLDKVYKVEKALYGLHQAPRAWKEMYTEFEKIMHKKFQMSSMGELTFFLGLQVTQKDDGIFISQDKYVDEILKKFGFLTVKTASTPMETSKPLMKDENVEVVDVYLYRSMIGSLMYLTSSRPDIMFAVCACTRFQVTPKVSHLHVVKRIFRYLKGQPKLSLLYPKDSPFNLEAYIDSDYAGVSLDRKFTTGGCQFLGRRLISWQCKKQTIVTNSTTEAEYVAASSCCGQVSWIQNQMLDYGYNFMNTKIFIDNESTICIVKNPVFHSKTKHIEIRHHFIRDSNKKNLIQMIKIHTDHNVADLLTKAFDVSRFQYLIAMLLVILNTAELMLLVILSTARVLALETTKTNQAMKIDSLKRRVKKLENKKRSRTHKLKRLYRVGLSARIESSEDEGLGDQEDASKLERKIADIDQDLEVTLVDETQGRNDEDILFDVNDDLQGEEVVVEKKVAEKEVSIVDPVTTAGEVITPEEVTLAQALVQIKTSKPKAKGIVFKEPSESTTTPIPIVTPQQLSQAKDKGKAKRIEPEKPLKKKDQIMFDEKVAQDLQAKLDAELEEEERIARQREEEANLISWDNTQAMMDADYELAQRLQAEE
ncbi:putative ribonuclease H-like domain-containing protein [Tanacetum coccineum]|uniref:Ribonuclease H-like domain-containing protein n=1 Tax=Tanacetum coccineum TaxID=301880 RepID=A0ABQ5ILY2_9ASTR